MAAPRDATIISYYQRISDQTIHLPPAPPTLQPSPTPTTPTPIPPHSAPPPTYSFDTPPPPPQNDIGTSGDDGGGEVMSSRWLKAEVLALIKLRSGGSWEGPLVGPFVWHEELANLRLGSIEVERLVRVVLSCVQEDLPLPPSMTMFFPMIKRAARVYLPQLESQHFRRSYKMLPITSRPAAPKLHCRLGKDNVMRLWPTSRLTKDS